MGEIALVLEHQFAQTKLDFLKTMRKLDGNLEARDEALFAGYLENPDSLEGMGLDAAAANAREESEHPNRRQHRGFGSTSE